MPARLRGLSFTIAPVVGYVAFCFLTIWFSGLFDAPIIKTNLWAVATLGVISAAAAIQYRTQLPEILRAAKTMPLLFGIMMLVVFTPVILLNADLYVGTVNPDFYQSLSFHEALMRFSATFWGSQADLPTKGLFLEAFPTAFQARFGGVTLSVLLEQLFGIPARTALISAVVLFLLCLPPAVHFFCRTALEFTPKQATLAAIFVAIAGPTTMSFLHTFIGQNSALAMLPLTMGLIHLALKERSIRVSALSAIILGGMFWIYFIILPYVLAPFGLAGAIKLIAQRGRRMGFWFLYAFVVCAIMAVVHVSVFEYSQKFTFDVFQFMGKLTQSQYYLDFLTEEVFQYALGLSSYPLAQNMYFRSFNDQVSPVLITMGILLAGIYFWTIKRWSRTASRDAVFLILSTLFIYGFVWVHYTFSTLYGYASFKMAAWLQFIAAPFFAWALLDCREQLRRGCTRVQKWVAYGMLSLLIPYVVLNLATDLDYGLKSFGYDRYHGSLINAYGIAGNRDFLNLPQDLEDHIPAGSTVGLGFGDSVENFWVLYYVEKLPVKKVTVLTHEKIPFEDAWLPDIHTRVYYDSLGQKQIDGQDHFHGGRADYYLLPGKKNLNKDIISDEGMGKPIWENDTFALYKAADIKDLVRTGRGYARKEYMRTGKPWWWPQIFRWVAEGGELYQLKPSRPGQPYRVEFSSIVGLGHETGQRVVELWHNGVKFDEIKINGAARVVSKPYRPIDGVNRIVLKIQEKSASIPRNWGLWNRHLPRRSTPINALFSHVRIVQAGVNSATPLPENTALIPQKYFEYLETFNGFDVDGWVREKGEFTVQTPADTRALKLQLHIPGNLEFTFPYKVQFLVNGKPIEYSFDEAGDQTVTLDLPNRKTDRIKVEILPEKAKHMTPVPDRRDVLQSIRISAITVLTDEKGE